MSARGPEAEASLLSLSLHRLKRHHPPLEAEMPRESMFQTGRNVWRVEPADRGAFLIDADAYFRSCAEALASAKKQILILGWDTDSRTELPAPQGFGSAEKTTIELGELLCELTKRNPELSIYVLSWDFAFIYLFERESFPALKFSSLSSDRLRFVLDREHPTLASHHQKIVVVDDQVGFSGGLDLTQRRWDTPEHRAYDERRVDPGGHIYGPFHDVQICVEGRIAKALGDLARLRWRAATNETIHAPQLTDEEARRSPWPVSLEPTLRSFEAAVSRTLPLGECGRLRTGSLMRTRPVTEVEKLFLDAIKSARRYVYIENQYFTSPVIAKAIAKRLREPDGPEFVMVLPRDQTGWIEESTMGVLRSKALRIVEEADVYDRWRCYYPIVPNLGPDGYVKVHSKVMVIDDECVRIGSANMNSRSLGLDTECDVTIEAHGRPELRRAFSELRKSLLGEHLDIDPDEFEARFILSRSLVGSVESFCGRPRTLIELRSTEVPDWITKVTPPSDWIDPKRPSGIRRWFMKRFQMHRYAIGLLLIASTIFGLMYLQLLESKGELPTGLRGFAHPAQPFIDAWVWLRSWDAQKISILLSQIRGEAWTYPAILVGFVIGSLLFIPITAMIVGIAIAFASAEAFTLAFGGSMLAALATYGVGRYWAWSKSRFLSRPWVQKVSAKMRKGGALSVAAVRLAPIAPFSAIGIVAGGLRLNVIDYLIGTAIGLLPGIVVLTLVSAGASRLVMQGKWTAAFWVLLAFAVVALLLSILRKRGRKNQTEERTT